MKNMLKFLGIIIFAIIIGFTFISCSNPILDIPNPQPPTLSGTVFKGGIAAVGHPLMAITTDLAGNGATSYEWRRDETNIIDGANSNTYIIQNADIGSTITVTVTRDGYLGSVTSVPIGPITVNVEFIPVIDIVLTTNPSPVTAGIPTTLSGMITPADATSQTITWSIYNAGTTGATIAQGTNILNTTAAGTVIVRATILNGAAQSSDFIKNFPIEVGSAPSWGINLDAPPLYTFTPMQVGYAPVTPLAVRVNNMGNQATGVLTVELTGSNPTSFVRSPISLESIEAGGYRTFTIGPNHGLAANTYSATITVSSANEAIKNVSFNVSFTVSVIPTFDVNFVYTGTGVAQTTPNPAAAGNAVSISASPGNGFEFTRWEVAGGGPFSFSPNATTSPASFTMPANDVSVRAVFTELPALTPSLSLSQTTFTPVNFGYAQPAARNITITNTGTAAANVTSIIPGGTHHTSFTWGNLTGVTSIPAGGNATITVRPNAGLSVANYNATITVAYSDDRTASNTVSFTVNPARIMSVAITGVVAPVLGATPSTASTSTGNFSRGNVTWSPNHNPFQGGTEYTASIILTANAGHTFTGLSATNATINGLQVTISNNTGDRVTLSRTFPATPTQITSVAITGVVTPVLGAMPSTASAGTGNFSRGNVTWSPVHNPFQGGTEYTASIILTANTGHTFTGLANATINGQQATVSNNTGSTVTLSRTFPATPTPITSVAITGVVAPVLGAAPSTASVGTGNFSRGNVTWSPIHNPFRGGTVYTASIILTANTGHTFTGLSAANATINGQQATISNNTGDRVTLSRAFPVTDADPITNAVITGVVAPVLGDVPSTASAGTGNFSRGNVTWSPIHNPFQGNTVYTASIILTANTGHTFTGLLAANATINGQQATISQNFGDRVTLSRSFPATAAAPPPLVEIISAGGNHTVFVRENGTLWTWGDSSRGQTGLRMSAGNTSIPFPVGRETNWASISAGNNHTVAVTTNGQLWAWGNNGSGQLGDGTTTNRNIPVRIGTATNWASVSAGDNHTVAVTTTGQLWAWGRNWDGATGLNTTSGNTLTPTRVGTATNWVSVSAGDSHTVAITTNGQFWAWGNNQFGQLGDGTTTQRNIPTRIGDATNWRTMSAGDIHTVAVRMDGTLWAWGSNWDGRTGLGITSGNTLTPTRVGEATNWVSVSAGSGHTMAIREGNTLWGWGSNGSGQLGDGTTTSRSIPAQVQSGTWTFVSAGSSHTVAIRTGGALWTWGSNREGQLGNGTVGAFTNSNTPIQVTMATVTLPVPTVNTVTAVAAGNSHTLVIGANGTLWGWGNSDNGQTGLRMLGGTPTAPLQAGIATNWASVSAGAFHTVAVTTNGQLWAWGNNQFGQLGNGTTTNHDVPVRIGTATNWASVSAGERHTVAVTTTGQLWAWGRNWDGATGLDTTSGNTLTPTRVGIATNWASVSAGAFHTVAVTTNGQLWAWGDRGQGRLGDGESWGNQNTPIRIGDATNWRAVSAGAIHTVAIRMDGTLWAWGSNANGQTGLGITSGNTLIPTRVGETTNWVSVSAGSGHTMAIREGNTLWGWGANSSGQLGDGTTTQRNAPHQVQSGTWTSVSAGRFHTVAIRTGGELWTWGSNLEGQLGSGAMGGGNSVNSTPIRIIPSP
ncbi:MAG: hypothetical protein FWD87_09485 [Spirochaetaceae bacterium]|nr:hypothetical protein [Spirochaetaceae bacterium]